MEELNYLIIFRKILMLRKLTLFFLITDVRGIANRKHVQEGYEQVQQALLEYTVTCYPQIQVCIF